MQVQNTGDVVQQDNSNFDPIKTPTMTKHVSDDIPAHARSKKRGASPGKVVTTQATTHDSTTPGSPPATSNLKGPPRKKSRGDLSQTAAKTDATDKNTDSSSSSSSSRSRSEIPTSATGYWSYMGCSDGQGGSTSSYSGSQGASSDNAIALHTSTAERAEVEGEAGANKRDQDSVKQDAGVIRGDNRSTDTSRPSPTLEVQPPKSPAASSHRQ